MKMDLGGAGTKILVSVAAMATLYVAFLVFSDGAVVLEQANSLDPSFLLLAAGISSLGYLLRAVRWFGMLKRLGINVGFGECAVFYFSGYAFYMTPGRVGEVIRSKHLRDRRGIEVSRSAVTVAVERIYDVLGIILVAALTSSATFGMTVVYAAGALVLAVYALIYQRTWVLGLIARLAETRRFSRAGRWLLESFDSMLVLLRPSPTVKGTGLTAASWVLEGIGMFMVFYGFGADVDVLSVVFVFVASSLIGNAVLSPGGIGSTELSMVGLLHLLGHSYNEVIVPVLVTRMLTVFFPISIGMVANALVSRIGARQS